MMTHDPDQQALLLSTLSSAPAENVCALADEVLALLPNVQVRLNRTGLVMLPYSDTRKGATFHLGEVLVAEAQVQVAEVEGYGACLGRDTRHALAIAVLDAAYQSDTARDRILAFVAEAAEQQRHEEETLMKKVESTRVEMETY